MPPIIELIFIVVTMIIAFALAFLLMFLLALFLSPIERSLSNAIWGKPAAPPPKPAAQASFKDFSKKLSK